MSLTKNNLRSSLNSYRTLKFFTVEIVTFSGDSYLEEIEAHSEEEAQEIAASLYDDVDYTMIQGCYTID